jgi:UrcA family protein
MITPNKILMLALVFAVSAAALSGSVRAYGADGPARVSVRTDDLDFSHAPDAQVLLDRLADASVKACGGAPDFRRTDQIEAFDRCRKAVIARAVREVNIPIVTEIAAAQALPMRMAVR